MSVHPYVHMSVCLGLGGNVLFSAPNQDRGLISSSFATYGCCHPYLICDSIYSTLKK